MRSSDLNEPGPATRKDEFVARSSRLKTVPLILGSLAFVTGGLWMIGAFGPAPGLDRYPQGLVFGVGCVLIVFFGLCGAGWVGRLFDRKTQLWIGSAGLRSTPWSDQIIPWPEITDVTVWGSNGQKTIVLHLRDPSRFPGRRVAAILAGANRGLTGGDVCISLTGTDRSAEDALSSIEYFYARASRV